MEFNKKVDEILKELKFGKFNKVILDTEKLLKKYQVNLRLALFIKLLLTKPIELALKEKEEQDLKNHYLYLIK